MTPSAGNTYMDTTVYNTDIAGDNLVKIAAGRNMVIHQYKFTLTATAAGGATSTSVEITLDAVCGPSSFDSAVAAIVVSSAYQVKEAGLASTYFLAELVNPLKTPCPLSSVMYETWWGSGVAHSQLADSSSSSPASGSEYYIVPTDINLITTYSFTIKATMVGGAVFQLACTL